ncbi:MAG: 5'/3'-nucleotidase SurE [Fimbriimonas sp.]
MRILITNDDGVHAVGIHHLASVARQFGEVKIVAPDRERSACGHAMTMRDPLRVEHLEIEGLPAFAVNGVPTDCINVGLTLAWPDGCDLVLSGINNGPNLGFDVTYSGTVAGAMEGTINEIRSISVSMAAFVSGAPLHYETATAWLTENWALLTEVPLEPLTFLNINVPAIDAVELRGHRVVGMGQRVYKDRVEMRSDPWGRPYYWQGGAVVTNTSQPGTDVEACREGFVSITPVSLDWTAHGQIDTIAASLSRA